MTQPVNVQSLLGAGQDGVSAQPNTGPGYEGGGKFNWTPARPFDDLEFPNEPGPRKWVAIVPGAQASLPISIATTWAEYRTAALASLATGTPQITFWDDFAPLSPVEDVPQPPYLYAGYIGMPQGFNHWFSGKTVTVQEDGNPIPVGATATFEDGDASWVGDGYVISWGALDKLISGGSGYDAANPPQVCAVLRIGGDIIGTVCTTGSVWNGAVDGVVDGEFGAEGFIETDVFDDFPLVEVIVDPPPVGGGDTREITDTSPTGHSVFMRKDDGRMGFARVYGPQYAGLLRCRIPVGETSSSGLDGPHNFQINWEGEPLAVPELDLAEQFEGRLREYWTGVFLEDTDAPGLIPFDLSSPTYTGGAAWDALQTDFDYAMDPVSFQEVDWPGGWVVDWRLEAHTDNPDGEPPFTDAIYAGDTPDNQWWVPYGVFIAAQPTYGNGTGPYLGIQMTAELKDPGGLYSGLPRTNEPNSGEPVTPVANVSTSIATSRGDTCPYVLPVQGAEAGTI